MTAGAQHPDATEDLGGPLQCVVGVIAHGIESRSGTFRDTPLSAENFASELVKRPVGGHRFAEPLPEGKHRRIAQLRPTVLQQVSPLQRPLVNERLGPEQLLNQPGPFLRILVRKERLQLIGFWLDPRHVDRDPPQKTRIIDKGRRADIHRVQLLDDKPIDDVVGRHGGRFEVLARFEDQELGSGERAFEPGRHGGLAEHRCLHQTVTGHRSYSFGVDREHRQPRHVAPRTVRVGRDHLQLLLPSRPDNHAARINRQGLEGRGSGGIGFRPFPDPAEQQSVFQAVSFQTNTTLVSHLAQGLGQKQACRRVVPVDSASQEFIGQ